MPRRPLKKKLPSDYEFADDAECESSEKYGGLHRVEPSATQWPPKAKHGEPDPYVSLRCTRCGCWCLTYADNDPDKSGIEVVLPDRKPKEKVPT